MTINANSLTSRVVRDLGYCAAVFAWSFVALAIVLTGFALTASLIFLGIGVVVWIGFVLAARLTTAVDRSLARWHSGRPIAAVYERSPARGFVPLLKTLTYDPQTWRDMGWLGLTSVAGLTLGLLGLLATAVALADITLPIWYWAVSDPHAGYAVTNFGFFTVDSIGEAFAAAWIGLVLLPFALLFARACATAHAALAARVLGPPRPQHTVIQGGMRHVKQHN